MSMETEELREKLAESFGDIMQHLNDEAADVFFGKEHQEYEKEQAELLTVLNELIGGNLDEKNAYCAPPEEFYSVLAKVLSFRVFYSYSDYTLAENITDEQLLASASAIRSGNLDELDHLRKDAKGENVELPMDEVYYARKQLVNNLGYFFHLMAHQAKRYGAREAAIGFLRNFSILKRCQQDLLLRLSDEQVAEIVDNAREGMDGLKVAADYAGLGDWEPFRAAEAEKFAAEKRRAAEKASQQES